MQIHFKIVDCLCFNFLQMIIEKMKGARMRPILFD